VGLLTVRRRRLTACGVQAVGSIQHVFEWFYVYGAIAPTTGERFFLELPYLNADTFQLFVDAFAEAFPDSLNILLLNNSGAHTAQYIRWPAHVRCVWLPPYCPELNPIERVWRDLRDLKDDLAWLQFTDLDAQQVYGGALLQGYEAYTLRALTGYPYLVEAEWHEVKLPYTAVSRLCVPLIKVGVTASQLGPASDGVGFDPSRSSGQKAAEGMNPSNCRVKNDFRLTSCHSALGPFW
jgi:hypothetical protein